MVNPSRFPAAHSDSLIDDFSDIGRVQLSSRPAGASGIVARLAVWAFVLLASLTAGNAFASGFVPAAAPTTARSGHTTTLLPSGKVLVVGGMGAGGATLSSTELYDPATNTWGAGPALTAARANHTATLLRSGKVLVVGGYDGTAFATTAQLYDPVTNTWSAAAAPSSTRMNHTATMLPSGKVFVVGGNNESVLNAAEIYDAATDSWAAARPLNAARTSHTATLMPSGRVLVVGGFRISALNSAVLYDPPTDTWIGALTLAMPRSAHTATLMPNGKVLVTGGLSGSTAIASAEIFDATTGWSAAPAMGAARQAHAATLLSTGVVFVAGGTAGSAAGSARLGGAESYDPATNRWTHAGNLVAARSHATLTSLPNGLVLLAGGADAAGPLASAELFDRTTPYFGIWMPGGTLAAGRRDHTTTALPSGKALVVGGGLASDGNSALASVELYDPAANAFAAAAPLAVARRYHSATLMPSGKVLVVGGFNGTNMLNTAVLYDPATNTWSGAGTLGRTRALHTATLLLSGKVLIVGGTEDGGGMPNTAEVYDPATNAWTPAGTITTVRFHHVAALLGSGKVLIAGGDNGPSAFNSVEIYDPATSAWSPGPPTSSARQEAVGVVLPSGKVLVIGGVNVAGQVLSSAEQYDPATNSWSDVAWMSTQRRWHVASLLPSGKVLVAGGVDAYFNYNVHDWAELYDPVLNLWTTAGAFGTHRHSHTLTTLASGKVMITGGTDGTTSHAGTMLYQPQSTTLSNAATAPSGRGGHTATMLSTGQLLLAGGADASGPTGTAQRYDPSANTWSAATGFTTARRSYTATTLPDGRVLAIGGLGSAGALASVERYDPAVNQWSAATPLAAARRSHTATLLASGQVLVAGGFGTDAMNSAERYDPATNVWTGAGTLTTARYQHAATLLPSGKVLVSGGNSGAAVLNTAELYDPATNSWSGAGTFSASRELHTSTLLPSGKVLLAGGRSGTSYRGAMVVYDPAANTWTTLNSGLFTATFSHTATLLPSGRVLIAGGDRGDGGGQRRAAIYDPVTEVLTAGAPLAVQRYGHTATLLPTGKVLIAGGFNAGGAVTSTELYDPDLAPVAARRPDLASAGNFATPTAALTANSSGTTYSNGAVQTTGLLSPVDGSGGNGTASSATGLPVIQVQRLDNEQQRYLDGDAVAGVTDTLFTGRSTALAGFPPGPVLVRAWVNGVPGTASYTTIAGTAGQPTAVSAIAGALQATVNFTAPTNYTGGAPITSYVATATGGATASCTAPCTSIVFNPLPGGTYTFTVSAVNAAGAGTPSTASNSIVVQAAPTLSMSSSTNPGTVGDNVTFTATLAQAVAPTGNVQFCANSTITLSGCVGGTVLCTVPANASPIACTTAALPAGTHLIAAWYAGDANNLFAATSSLSQVVDKRMPSLSWTEPAPITYGTALGAAQLSASATWNGSPVAGTFTYTPPAGTVLGAGAGQLLSATFVPADTATYATSGVVVTTTLLVNAVATTTAIGSVGGARVGVALNVPYTVSGAAGAPAVPGGGSVVVTAAPGGATCSATVAAGQCAITFAAAGNYALTAQYDGDTNYMPSASSPATAVTVSVNTTATTLSTAPNPSVLGQPVTASVSVADTTGGPVPTGNVNVTADSGEACMATLTGGAGQCTLTMTHLGAHTLTANYAGDAANAVSSGTTTQNVNRATVSVSVDDHYGYTRYNAVPSYVVTLTNASPVVTHPVLTASTPGTGINLAGAQWFCTANGGGSGCVDGSGLFTANATLPANGTMTWTLLVPVVPTSGDPTIELRIAVGGDVNPTSASDINTLVIFRNGVEVPGDTQ